MAQSTANLQPAQIGAEALDDVLEVAVGRHLDAIDLAAAGGLRLHQRLDLELGRVGELAPVVVEELDPVVLGRVVRGGDDDAQIERQQGHRRRRQHAAEHRHSARLDDAARERLLELDARRPACRGRRRRGRCLDQSVAARASCSTSSTVRSSPTTPRTPSVPK